MEAHEVHFLASIHEKFIRIASNTSEYGVAHMQENQLPYLVFLIVYILIILVL